MTKTEALKATAVLCGYFPGAIPEATVKAWSKAIQSKDYDDAVNGAQKLAQIESRPTLAKWLTCISFEFDRRLQAIAPKLIQAPYDPGAHRKAAAARTITGLMRITAHRARDGFDKPKPPINTEAKKDKMKQWHQLGQQAMDKQWSQYQADEAFHQLMALNDEDFWITYADVEKDVDKFSDADKVGNL